MPTAWETLAAAAHPRRAAAEEDRHVRAELGGELEQVGLGYVDLEQPVDGEHRGGGVGRSPAEPARGRDALAQRELHSVPGAAGSNEQAFGRSHREVLMPC